MGETQALEGFWASIGHASWAVVLGYAIVAVCIGLKGLTEGKLHGAVKAWFGAISGMLIGVGSSMALESDWIHAVVFGVLVGGASTGFWQMVKSTIPDLGKPSNPPPAAPTSTILSTTLAGLLIIWALLGSGCAVRQAQVAVQTSLTSLAVAVDAGDQALAAAEPEIRANAVACAREACAATGCPDATAYLEDCYRDADAAVDGLEVAVQALRVAQAAQDAWVASGQLPDAMPLCDALGDALEPCVSLLDEAGVDVPPGISGAGAIVDAICLIVARWADGQ